MPYLCIHTNLPPRNAGADTALLQRASTLVADQLDKPESYVMVRLAPAAAMLFGGSADPCAYLELKSIDLPADATADLSAALCGLMEDALGIPAARVYIEFVNAPADYWGWDGGTF